MNKTLEFEPIPVGPPNTINDLPMPIRHVTITILNDIIPALIEVEDNNQDEGSDNGQNGDPSSPNPNGGNPADAGFPSLEHDLNQNSPPNNNNNNQNNNGDSNSNSDPSASETASETYGGGHNSEFGGGSPGPNGGAPSGDTPGNEDGSIGYPVLIDLDGDNQISMIAEEDSNVFFDYNGDGYTHHSGWVAGNDGFLVYDKDEDGTIEDHDELSFISYLEGAETDLEGLKHFDTNNDNILNAQDTEWAKFKIWQDANEDGITDAGELKSLASLNINGLELTSTGTPHKIAGNTILGETRFLRGDGTTMKGFDAAMALSAYSFTTTEYNDGIKFSIKFEGQTENVEFAAFTDEEAHTITLADSHTARIIQGGDGVDTFTASGSNSAIFLGLGGNDMLNGGSGGDLLVGGRGADTLNGGGGNDVYVFSLGDGQDIIADEAFGTEKQLETYEATETQAYLTSGPEGDQVIRTRKVKVTKTREVDVTVVVDGGDDALIFGNGITLDSLVAKRNGNDLQIGVIPDDDPTAAFNTLSDVVTLKNWYDGDKRIEYFVIEGAQHSINFDAVIQSEPTSAFALSPVLSAFNIHDIDDILVSSKGADTLNGGDGNDAYVFSLGDGQDIIADETFGIQTRTETYTTYETRTYISGHHEGEAIYHTGPVLVTKTRDVKVNAQVDGGDDTLIFGQNITTDDLLVQLIGNDLLIGIKDDNNPSTPPQSLADRVTLKNWKLDNTRIETIIVDNVSYDIDFDFALQGVSSNLFTVSSIISSLNIDNRDDVMLGGSGANALNGRNGNNVLSGDAGADTLKGGKGDDVYIFSLGDGQDIIVDEHIETGTRTETYQVQQTRTYTRSQGEAEVTVTETYYVTKTRKVKYKIHHDAGDDTLAFGPGITLDDLLAKRVGNDLLIGLNTGGDASATVASLSDVITLKKWYQDKTKIEEFAFLTLPPTANQQDETESNDNAYDVDIMTHDEFLSGVTFEVA